jgi:hypothetical protein
MFHVEPDTPTRTNPSYEEVEKALRARRDRILLAFESGESSPTPGLLEELVEINIKLGEA